MQKLLNVVVVALLIGGSSVASVTLASDRLADQQPVQMSCDYCGGGPGDHASCISCWTQVCTTSSDSEVLHPKNDWGWPQGGRDDKIGRKTGSTWQHRSCIGPLGICPRCYDPMSICGCTYNEINFGNPQHDVCDRPVWLCNCMPKCADYVRCRGDVSRLGCGFFSCNRTAHFCKCSQGAQCSTCAYNCEMYEGNGPPTW